MALRKQRFYNELRAINLARLLLHWRRTNERRGILAYNQASRWSEGPAGVKHLKHETFQETGL
jgi:hypothetical protein